MKKIKVKTYDSSIVEYMQIKTIMDIDEHINAEKEFSELHETINDIKKERIGYGKADIYDTLLDMNRYLNDKTERSVTLPTGTITFKGFLFPEEHLTRNGVMDMKRDNMVEVLNKYGELWLRENGTYCTPIKGYEVINE